MSRIYLSSTYRDLVEQREAVYRALREIGHDVVAMEDYVAADARPTEKCLRDVVNADVYVGVFAWRYGFVPADDNPERLSVTELEYRQAERSGVPCLIFVLRADAPWSPTQMDSHTGDNDSGARIERLRRELTASRLCGAFTSSEELARKVTAAVHRCLTGPDAEPSLALDPDLPRRRFVGHMRAFAGAMSDRQAGARYVELALQEDRPPEEGYSEVMVGPLRSVVAYPANCALIGPHGSGKTTLLLREAQRIVEDGDGLPVYVSGSDLGRGDGDTVLELAAEQNLLNARRLLRSWRLGGDRIRLLVDGVDRRAHVPTIVAALGTLDRVKAADNTIVVATPDRAVVEALGAALPLRRLLVLPLDLDAVTTLLAGHGRDDLSAAVRSLAAAHSPLLAMLGQPELLTAWAQAPRVDGTDPPSLSGIVGTQLRHLLTAAGQAFDPVRVVAPALGLLAFRVLAGSRAALAVNDDLFDEVGELLEAIHRRYRRRRNVMPPDWSAETLLRSVARSPVIDIERRGDGSEHLSFSRTLFTDWYAARHLRQLATAGGAVPLAITELIGAGAEGALVHLVDDDPAGAAHVDVIATVDSRMAERVWVAGTRRRTAPASLQREFERLVGELSHRSAGAAPHGGPGSSAHAPDPRHRLGAVHPSSPVEALLDLAADPHPLVTGAAEYVLLHSADDPTVPFGFTGGQLNFSSHGAGQVTIAGLRLLSVRADSPVRLMVSIGKWDVDPFESPDTFLRFLPLPASAVVAEILSDTGGQDWLRAAATACVTALDSYDRCVRAGRRPELADLARRLFQRAVDQAALATVIGADLGLRLPELPHVPDAATIAATDAYGRLRQSFDPRSSEPRAGATPTGVEVRSGAGTVNGRLVSVEAGTLTVESRYTDGYHVADPAHINLRTSARRVENGSAHGLVVGTLQGSDTPLPIRLRVDVRLSADVVVDGALGGVTVDRIAGGHPNWEVDCRISVGRLLGRSSLHGVVVREDADTP